jgi:hypothetical protein
MLFNTFPIYFNNYPNYLNTNTMRFKLCVNVKHCITNTEYLFGTDFAIYVKLNNFVKITTDLSLWFKNLHIFKVLIIKLIFQIKVIINFNRINSIDRLKP